MQNLDHGVTALARAGATSWFDGHYGGALIAAYYLPPTPELAAYAREWAAQNPALFAPFADDVPDPDAEKKLLAGARRTVAPLKNSGHGVIYSALALRAWHTAPHLFTAAKVDGIVSLLEKCLVDRPTRYYGVADYWAFTPSRDHYRSTEDLILRTLHSLREIYPDGDHDGQHYYLSAEKLHSIDYAAALVDLEALGYGTLARDGWESHRRHVELTQLPPPPGVLPKPQRDPEMMPWKARYWKRDHLDDHAIKLAYGGMRIFDRLHESIWVRLAR